MNERAEHADAGEVDESTIVVNTPGRADHAAGSEAGLDTVATGDETVVVASDETIAVVHDATIAVVRVPQTTVDEEPGAVSGTDAAAAGDETIVVAAHAAPETREHSVGDATVVVPIASPERRRDRRAELRGQSPSPTGSNPAPPIAQVAQGERRRSLRQVIGAGLDPQRPISQPPGMAPWEIQPSGERGVSPDLPVSYGARLQTEVELQTGVDEVRRRIGPAPAAAPVQVVQGRTELPSLRRRDRRRSRVTVAVYAAVVVACVLGLCGVASIAFGW